jgi:uncharacterized lipoprotein YmbA
MKLKFFAIPVLLMLTSLTGCLNVGAPARPDSATFYLLASRSVSPQECFLSGHNIYVRAVTLPGYLESNKIAVRDGYKVDYSIEAQWSEPLQQSVTRCVSDALLSSISLSSMTSWPEPMSKDAEYFLQVNFSRFNGTVEGHIEVEGNWQIISSKDHSLVRSGVFKDYDGTYSKISTDSLIKGLSNALGRACNEIVSGIGE